MSESFAVRVYKEYFNFASAHFLIFADGAREELHGHNYQVRVSARGALDAGDVVLDFTKLKPLVKKTCDGLDHRVIFPTGHPLLRVARTGESCEAVFSGKERFVIPARDVVLLPIHNTSTERLAEWIAHEVLGRIRSELPAARLSSLEVEVEESGGQCGVFELTIS
ncbi:6-carboxytetrahydropterin synthase [bacterium]|nr:6-carboxytetrahydropterin synthase [bacterium]